MAVPILQLPGTQQVQQQQQPLPILIPIPRLTLGFLQMDWTTASSLFALLFLLILIAAPIALIVYLLRKR